jgi:hypothetical protein
MAIVERHTTLDGLLELIVDLTDGNWTIGFASGRVASGQFLGHTHGDILAEFNGGSPESATRAYVDDVIMSRRVIVVSRIAGQVRDAWVEDDNNEAGEIAELDPDKMIEKRFWNGKPAQISS